MVVNVEIVGRVFLGPCGVAGSKTHLCACGELSQHREKEPKPLTVTQGNQQVCQTEEKVANAGGEAWKVHCCWQGHQGGFSEEVSFWLSLEE